MLMQKEQQLRMIIWLKRIAAALTIFIWLYAMVTFLKDPAPFADLVPYCKDPAPFADLVPYCMGSTMLIFGVLTMVYKGLEYWEKQINPNNER